MYIGRSDFLLGRTRTKGSAEQPNSQYFILVQLDRNNNNKKVLAKVYLNMSLAPISRATLCAQRNAPDWKIICNISQDFFFLLHIYLHKRK